MRKALSVLVATVALTGCASTNNLSSEVSSYSLWPAGRQASTYTFERLPSQQANVQQHQLLEDAALEDSCHDFGKDLIPRLVRRGQDVYAHDFHGSCVNMTNGKPYWRDVGTLDAFWEANMDLTRVVPELNLYDKNWPIWTYQEQNPPAKFVFDDADRRGAAVDSIVAGGCIVSGSTVKRSLLFTNVRVHNHCRIEDSVILPGCEIGPTAVVRNAIIDKRCRILSGGEKARVVLSRMLYDPPNFLVLDEPTNHLDLDTKEMLVKALGTFEGTLLFVSHDRRFLSALSNRVLELGPEGPKQYGGGYTEYVASTGREAPGLH